MSCTIGAGTPWAGCKVAQRCPRSWNRCPDKPAVTNAAYSQCCGDDSLYVSGLEYVDLVARVRVENLSSKAFAVELGRRRDESIILASIAGDAADRVRMAFISASVRVTPVAGILALRNLYGQCLQYRFSILCAAVPVQARLSPLILAACGKRGLMDRATAGWGSGLLGVMIFSGSLPATRVAVADLSPMFLTSMRAVIAAVLGATFLIALQQVK